MRFRISLLCLVGLFLQACASSQPELKTDEPLDVVLNKATLVKQTRLNVTIVAFDTSVLIEDGKTTQFYRLLRNAEAGFLPVLLKNTLIESGHWGAVRVLPNTDPTAEVTVTSQVLKSDSVTLSLRVKVVDSRGVQWLDKVYSDSAVDHAYRVKALAGEDPFQDIYNQIANDIVDARNQFQPTDLSKILDMSMLRYAIALSPDAFQHFLPSTVINPGESVEALGLPARNDRMYLRVNKIRETEYQFIDVMDDQFNIFYQKMLHSYPYWREYTFDLQAHNQKLNAAGANKSQSRSWSSIESSYKAYKNYKLNEDELRELSASFNSELKPTVAQYEGKVIELNGSLKNQYAEWRQILSRIYAAETQ